MESAPTKLVIFDEIHQLEDPSSLLKIAADEFSHLRVLATGSSTLDATKKFRDSLTGRKRNVTLRPVLFEELEAFNVKNLEGRLFRGGLPPAAEISRGEGSVRIRDNGPGLTADLAEKALRAGYSGNRPYDSLGLFGMGFNISSGKLGRTTRFLTARKGESGAIEVIVDLIALQEKRSYKVPVNVVKKAKEFDHGTIVEVRGWWPEGNPNNGFVRDRPFWASA